VKWYEQLAWGIVFGVLVGCVINLMLG